MLGNVDPIETINASIFQSYSLIYEKTSLSKIIKLSPVFIIIQNIDRIGGFVLKRRRALCLLHLTNNPDNICKFIFVML